MASFKMPELKQKTQADQFERAADRHSTSETIRVTVDLAPDLHRRLKVKAALNGQRMADLIREWVEQNTESI